MVSMDEHEGWNTLVRAMLHIQQARDCYDDPWLITGILDYCRRLILKETYPESKYIAELVREATTRMTPILESRF